MPLARYAMYAWGTQIYVAATWDHGEPWLSTLRHIAKEGRCFVIGCCMALRKEDLLDKAEALRPFYSSAPEWINAGDSAIVNPNGEFLAGPLHEAEGILYADIDRERLSGATWILDVAGHYARPDVFQLTVDTEARPMITAATGPASRDGKVGTRRNIRPPDRDEASSHQRSRQGPRSQTTNTRRTAP